MIKKFVKRVGVLLYALFALGATLFAGCATAMPTRVPPMSKEMGYKIPNINGWTLVLFNKGVYEVECLKLELLAKTMELVNKPAIELHGAAVDIWSMIATGGLTAGLPLAYKHVPKTPKKKEDEVK